MDGRFNVRSTDGEIACFGGRLPFYSFTGAYGLHYVKGTTIHLEVLYDANGNTARRPGDDRVPCLLQWAWTTPSGPLPFDEANPAEDPPYGLYGMLNDGRAGGYSQFSTRRARRLRRPTAVPQHPLQLLPRPGGRASDRASRTS